ncbi:MAG: methyltransferase domain-containing protein [Mycobacteriales bacterium]
MTGRPPAPPGAAGGGAAVFDPQRLGQIYDAPAVVDQRAATRRLLAARPGARVLDLGCGPGHLTAELAGDVGEQGHVLGLDRQPSMIEAARRRTGRGAGQARRNFVLGSATALPLDDASCDGVVAVQVLEYVPDLEQAVAELCRVLRPGGTAVLVDTDWRSCVWHSADRDRTDTVLRAWEEHFVHPHLPTGIAALLRAGGLQDVQVHAVPVVETDPAAALYSLGMADLIAAFVARRHRDLVEAWQADILQQAAAGEYFFGVTRFAAVATR